MQVVESTGIVVTPYLEYPQLLGVLLRMLNESAPSVRHEVLKARRKPSCLLSAASHKWAAMHACQNLLEPLDGACNCLLSAMTLRRDMSPLAGQTCKLVHD